MKKILAGFVIVYGLFMGFVVVKGALKSDQPIATTKNANSSQSSTGQNSSTPANKTYGTSEVSKHASRSDCWLIINNNVYDVSSFISQHPGGAREILAYCGKDATTAFDTQGGRGSHSSQASAMLKDYLIGSLQ